MQFVKHLNSLQIAYLVDHDLIVHEAITLLEVALHSLDAKVAAQFVADSHLLDDVRYRIIFLFIASDQVALELIER